MKQFYHRLYDRLEDARILQCIRSGLVMAIPVLMIGCIGLVLRSFPLAGYQRFITTFGNGFFHRLFSFVYDATFGLLALYMTATISICFARQFGGSRQSHYGAMLTSIVCFAIFSGFGTESFSLDAFGVKGMFIAIICSLAGSTLYSFFQKRIHLKLQLYADGVDGEFQTAVHMIFPMLATAAVFAAVNYLVLVVFGASSFQRFIISAANALFSGMGRGLNAALLYVFLASLMWFFGIHGSDVLEGVSDHLFVPAAEVNTALVAAGKAPTEIFSKTFFDVFVLMGGCGVAMCLLAALLMVSKRRSSRSLGRMAALPMLFNINELMVFGLPVVFNPILLIPFLLTPIVVTLISYLAMRWGLVPFASFAVEWTTPILLSGYLATRSAAGALLQLFNLAVGTLIYAPFVRQYDREKLRNSKARMNGLVAKLQQAEQTREPIRLLTQTDSGGTVARTVAEDLKHLLNNEAPSVYYQPQYDQTGRCIGAEALLRWEHPLYGMLYPPLVIKLADESGVLPVLEAAIIRKVAEDLPRLRETLGADTKICVNISASVVQTDALERYLIQLIEQGRLAPQSVCLEITEQMTLQFNDETIARFQRFRALGFSLAIDDFSMGSTSIRYLQENLFDMVKLDGALVCDIMDNQRSERIVASLIRLSQDLDFCVLAEYVETREQQKKLERLGCLRYQGWLYSKAVPIDQIAG